MSSYFIKRIAISLTLLLLSCSHISDRSRSPQSKFDRADKTIESTLSYLKEKQIDNEYWSGGYVTDVTSEAMYLGVGERLGLLSSEEKNKWTALIIQRMHPDKNGWYAYPGGQVDLNVTGYTLNVLKFLGLKENYPELVYAWTYYKKLGGDKNLNIVSKVQLQALNLLEEKSPEFPIHILGLPKILPMNIRKLGIHGELFISLLGFNAFKNMPDQSLAQMKNGKEYFYHLPLHIGKFYKTNPTDWAIETVAHVLQKQNKNKGWYGTWFTTFNLMLLNEAQRAGLGDFSQEIKSGWQAMGEWHSMSSEGFEIQQSMRSSIWDTAYTLHALKKNPAHDFDISGIENWLMENRVTKEKKGIKTSSWSFDHTDKSAPDIDDTAAVIHALATGKDGKDPQTLKVISEGINWIVENQNMDGGFPAWNKGVQWLPFLVIKLADKNGPDFMDASQADVTSRVLSMLNVVESLKLSSVNLTRVRSRACRFFNTNSEHVSNIDQKVFTGHWVTNYTYGASTLIQGLINGKCDEQKWVGDLTSWLTKVQQADGGWGEDNSSYNKKRYVEGRATLTQTVFVMNALMDAYEITEDKKIKDSIDKGAAFIMDRSREGEDFFEKEFTAVTIKGMSYSRYELLPAYMSLDVLERWRKL